MSLTRPYNATKSLVRSIIQEEQRKLGALPSSDLSYERILVRVGTAMLNEHLPEIIPYMVGSKFLDRSDDNNFAAAFFVFDINGLIVDIPIFLINGQVKGYQLLYVRDSKLFLPSIAEVIDFLKAQQDERSGEPTVGENANRLRRTSINSNVYSSRNRYLTSAKSAELINGAVQAFHDIMEDSADRFHKVGSVIEPPDWMALFSSRGARARAVSLAKSSPALQRKLANLFGDEQWDQKLSQFDQYIAGALKRAKQAEFSLASNRFLKHDTAYLPSYTRLNTKEAAAKFAGFESAMNQFEDFGAVFVDCCIPQESVKKAYMVEQSMEYGTPPISGAYSLFVENGDKRPVFAFMQNDNRSYTGGSGVLLVDLENKAVALAESSDVAVETESASPAPKYGTDGSLYSKLDTKIGLDARLEEPLLLVFDDGTVYGPIRLEAQNDNGFDAYCCHLSKQGSSNGLLGNSYLNIEERKTINRLVIGGDNTRTAQFFDVGDKRSLVVPASTKIIYVGEADDYGKCVKGFKILPLSSFDIAKQIKKAGFTLRKIAGTYSELDGKTMLNADVVEILLRSGVPLSDAMQTVKTAGTLRRHYLITEPDATLPKLASGQKLAFTLQRDDMRNEYRFDSPQPQPEGMSDGQVPVREVYGNREQLSSTGMEYADTGNAPWSSEQSPYTEPVVTEGNRSTAEEAGEMTRSADKLFENNAFVSMVNYVNPAVERERLISSLIKSCDGVGRSYFLLLVHGDEFAEAYGLGDASEMEQQLLTQHQGAGKILVTLFSRSVAAGSDLALTTMTEG